MKTSSRINGFIALAALVFLYAPILVVGLYSFNSARYGMAWKGFTPEWYAHLWENPKALQALQNTLILGLVSTMMATGLGTLLGLGLSRYRFPGKRILTQFLHVPLVMPDMALAAAFLLFFALVRQGLGIFELGMTTMIMAHVTFQIPFVAIVVRARMAGMDPALEEAAGDLGATAWQTFWHVTFPMVLPGMLAGALLAFTLSLDDFVISFFTTGPGATTLPIYIYSTVKRGITPETNALSVIMVAASVMGTLAVMVLQRRQAQAIMR